MRARSYPLLACEVAPRFSTELMLCGSMLCGDGAAGNKLRVLNGHSTGNNASAADLKFLHHLQQTLLGTSNRKAALES
jgi:hypothetical protein